MTQGDMSEQVETSISADPVEARSGWWRLLHALKWMLFLLVLAFAVHILVGQFALIDWKTVHFRALPVVGAFLFLLAVPPVQMLSYRTLLSAYASPPAWRFMPAIAWVPPMGRYLPGASVVGAMYMLRRLGVSAALAVGVVLAMDGIAVVVGLMVGSPLLLWPAVRERLPAGPALCAAMVIGGIVCLHPRVYARLINFALTKLGREPLPRVPPLRCYVVPVCCALGQWLLAGAAMWLLARALVFVPIGRLPLFVSVGALGYSIGYLAVFAAGSLGVREVVFMAGLQPVISPAALAAPVVVAQRIVQTCTELTAFLVGLWFYRRYGSVMQSGLAAAVPKSDQAEA
jgi:uncharacterized membrane protein YbhN (UPF0104 family)